MPERGKTNSKTYRVKNLTCVPTVRLLHDKLTDTGFRVKDITYGKITLEKYIIQKKIDRIKELIIQDEYTLSEIAYMMGNLILYPGRHIRAFCP